MRSFGQAACTQELEGLLAHKQHLVAMDLAGDEMEGSLAGYLTITLNVFVMLNLRLRLTPGEAAGSQSMRQAIQEPGATRIGHGVNAIHDPVDGISR